MKENITVMISTVMILESKDKLDINDNDTWKEQLVVEVVVHLSQ